MNYFINEGFKNLRLLLVVGYMEGNWDLAPGATPGSSPKSRCKLGEVTTSLGLSFLIHRVHVTPVYYHGTRAKSLLLPGDLSLLSSQPCLLTVLLTERAELVCASGPLHMLVPLPGGTLIFPWPRSFAFRLQLKVTSTGVFPLIL